MRHLAPYEFFSDPKLKEHLKGTKFNSDKDIQRLQAEILKIWYIYA